MQLALKRIQVSPFNAALGAEVKGLDLSNPLSNEAVLDLKRAWSERLVLLFRGQNLSPQNLLDFASMFGEIDPPGPNPYGKVIFPEYPMLNVISNLLDEKGEPRGNLGAGEAIWHSDMTYLEQPPGGIVLYSVEVPEGQGDTYFSNSTAAYEALPEEMKQFLEGKKAVHDAAHNSAGMLRKGYSETLDVRETPGAHHFLVKTDPLTGRKALFLGRRPHSYVVGMGVPESEALLDYLWAHATRKEFAWRHSWRHGDVLMWQNLWVLHRRDGFDPNARRVLHRAQIKSLIEERKR